MRGTYKWRIISFSRGRPPLPLEKQGGSERILSASQHFLGGLDTFDLVAEQFFYVGHYERASFA